MLLAHEKKTAAYLSELFHKGLIVKKYRVEVLGRLCDNGGAGIIDLPLDGKSAVTEYCMESYDPVSNASVALVTIRTGRFHQIRRHFDMIGHPVMGDPKYGRGNKNREGMRLTAYSLSFRCPVSGAAVEYSV
jgi:tRNA pseudouridine32 synthase/23S rRNA pseudouridine746 synthase